ncbi:MAG: polysaccharide deacetylase family protein [Roseimicrobium sp.]
MTTIAAKEHHTNALAMIGRRSAQDAEVAQSNRLTAASVSIDLDNLWSYLKTAAVPGWESYPGYLHLVVPRILDCLARHHMDATFFIVGRDAANPDNAAPLRAIADAGHEIANHSYEHEPWMPTFTDVELARDFQMSEAAIFAATGQRPRGFRGPGFCASGRMRDVLRLRGYAYDASLLPTFLGPVARFYFQLVTKLPPGERNKRSLLYGGFSNGTLPLRPFEIRPGLMEVPVTTMPFLRVPIHLSYLLFLAQHSDALARLYWRMAVVLCRMNHCGPSLLLHPTDFLDLQDVPEMKIFPAMGIPSGRKIGLVDFTLSKLTRHWRVGTILSHANAHRPAPPSGTPSHK